jgi:hypothetical protein
MSTVNIAALGNAQAIGYADTPISRDAAGKLALGNFVINVGQTVGAGQDNYVLTYDDATGEISLKAAAGGGDIVLDTTPQLGGNLDVNGNSIVSTSNADINITPNGTGEVNVGGGLVIDSDCRFKRTAASTLEFDDGANSLNSTGILTNEFVCYYANSQRTSLQQAGVVTVSTGAIIWSSNTTNHALGRDTSVRRGAAGIVQIAGLHAGTGAGLEMHDMTAPPAPAAIGVRIYIEDDGAGKTRLMALFGSGAAQQLAIEP